MSDQNKPGGLATNWVDYSVAGAKGSVNLIPIVGPLFAEIIGVKIPNQKMDRIAKYATDLESRLHSIEQRVLEERLEDEEFTDLLEEGFRQASRSLSDERRAYIASLIFNGLSSEAMEASESKHLLRILGEINDIEVVWLRFYLHPTMGGDEDFRNRHEELLNPVIPVMSAPPETRDKHALQGSYKEHLAQLGLLDRRYRTDMQTRVPEFDRFTGAMEISGYRLTRLGNLLLREIGLSVDR